jgi:hypothetical protein
MIFCKMSISFYPHTGLICFGSELASTKAGLTAKSPIPDLRDCQFDPSIPESEIDRNATRLDLDDLGGEVVLLDFGNKDGSDSGRPVVSRPSRHLPIHTMMNGTVKMVIYQVLYSKVDSLISKSPAKTHQLSLLNRNRNHPHQIDRFTTVSLG